MIDYILTIFILSVFVFSALGTNHWKKKHFVKEIYCSEMAGIIFYLISFVFTLLILILYFVSERNHNNDHVILSAILLFDAVMLFIYMWLATFCIYLDPHGFLVQKNFFLTKKIKINKEIKVERKVDYIKYKADNSSITIYFRHHEGNIIGMINEISHHI